MCFVEYAYYCRVFREMGHNMHKNVPFGACGGTTEPETDAAVDTAVEIRPAGTV